MIGGGGNSDTSPVPVCRYVSVDVKSNSSAMRTVSFISLSKGRLGVDVSSRDKLYQPSSFRLPITPISDEELSPTRRMNFAGSQFLRTTVNDPGGRIPGDGKYGVVSLMSEHVFLFLSTDRIICVCSASGLNGPGGA
jgi:hypothetical protein